jgi:hypothetical protein
VYVSFGGVKWDYAAVFMVTGFFVTIAGQMLTYHIISSCGRRSVIILAMAILLTTGAAIMVYEAAAAFVHAADDGWFSISSLCE